MNDPASPDANTKSEVASGPSPRAFCHATGFIYQGVGMVLALGACCWWSFAGRIQDEVRPIDEERQVVELRTDAAPHQHWAMAGVVLSFVGGLGLAVLGLGLQHDRPASAPCAKWMTLIVAVFYWAYLLSAIFLLPGAVTRVALPGIMAVVWTVLFLLAGVSHQQMRAHPPDPRSFPTAWTPRDEDDLRKALSPRSRDKTNP